MATSTCLSQVALHCTTGTSDKLYIVQVEQHELAKGVIEYRAVGYYGRRGGSLSVAEKYKGPSLAAANAEAGRLERDKRRDYTDYSIPGGIPGMPSDAPTFGGPAGAAGGASAGTTPVSSAPPVVGIMPMLADVLTEDRLEDLLADANWGMQRKYDGERVPVSMRRNGLTATNRKGAVRGLTTGAEKELNRLLAQPDFGDEKESVVDGELMGDEYIIYDIVTLRDNDMRKLSYDERYAALEELVADRPNLLAETAWTEEQKRAMLERARAEAWEGVVFRELGSAYVNGRTSVLLKFKLWASATCRVLTANTQRSIQVALRDPDGSEHFVGNVTVPVNMDIPDPDDLVEVRYLYATEGGMLYQPTLLQVRDDKDDADLRNSLRQAPPEKRSAATTDSSVVTAEPRLVTPADAGDSDDARAEAGAKLIATVAAGASGSPDISTADDWI
ncbi:RNA ligase family protein [Burkholderia ambifaria]|uniref:ATP-dependent DNA ligase n=1 Tax=Burkholderia ambifaria TaxID=152480 RepID=UPI000F7FBA30|nr:RNA ligase family protein [Burkholderia ambifaria]